MYNRESAKQHRLKMGGSVKLKTRTEEAKKKQRRHGAVKRAARSEKEMPKGWIPSDAWPHGLVGGVQAGFL